eukprot:8606311-Karenia_brevis.AAC.1
MRPRKSLFIPTGTKNGPPFADLENCRVTDVQFYNGDGEETIHDLWVTRDGQNRALSKRWTGRTICQVQSPSRKPAKLEIIDQPLRPCSRESYHICPWWFDE